MAVKLEAPPPAPSRRQVAAEVLLAFFAVTALVSGCYRLRWVGFVDRNLAVMAAAHLEVCWAMLNGERPPDGEALYYAIRDARAAGRKARDVARAVDEARNGRGRMRRVAQEGRRIGGAQREPVVGPRGQHEVGRHRLRAHRRQRVAVPQRWDIGFIRNFMLVLGSVSSVFDFLTFGLLLWVFDATAAVFQTGWFVESVLSASLIVLVIRTRRPCLTSRPSAPLLCSTLLIALVTILLPVTPIGAFLGFEPLPPVFWAALLGILLAYVAAAELAKKFFYRQAPNGR